MNARRSYVCVTITLTQNTITRLLDAINAALGAGVECPGAAREVLLQSTGGNTSSVFVGDSNVSATNGYELPAGASSAPGVPRIYRSSESNGVPVGNLYVFSAGVSQKLNVEVIQM